MTRALSGALSEFVEFAKAIILTKLNCQTVFLKIKKDHCLGGISEEVTPVPIPNTAVKLFCADDSGNAKVGRRQDNGLF